ncbi:L-fuconolactonase [Arthrobacter pigmenti]|uniref:L-fuconolactonase n=1 Tax=Arthrobacter pigmenti TaxID=271432 RepID=A0A846RPA2_9MICC|nr:amidohydrolase family protein [Arthrobacter pigmenti]NJC20936.1 L-fuconolactonase [Arthrobacter pigmenti]
MTGILDSHLHLWDLSSGGYSWLTPDAGELYRTYTAEQARAELDAAGVGSAVLVQADDTAADTEFLLAQASAHSWIAGVVGWVPLDNPSSTEGALAGYAANPALVGVRHLVHDDPRDDFLSLPEVRTSLKSLAAAGLPFDVPNAFPRHLQATVELARDLPELNVVLDHLGKPPRGDAEAMELWKDQLSELAQLPNVTVKVSGLAVPGQPLTVEALQPVWDLALDGFGPGRLMYGGDWPVSVLGGTYEETCGIIAQLADQLSPDERTAVMAGTATAVYLR